MTDREHVVRFTVFDDERKLRSATWRCWAPRGRGKSDVYLAARELGGAMKASLHDSGLWQISFTEEFVARSKEIGRWKGGPRHMDRWPRPTEIAPGCTLALRIVVSHSAVSVPAASLDSRIVRVPPPAPDRVREIAIVLTAAGTRVSGWPGRRSMGTALVGQFELDRGEHVWIVHHEDGLPKIQAGVASSSKVEPRWDEVGPEDEVRGLLLGQAEDGSRFVYEATVEGRPPSAAEGG